MNKKLTSVFILFAVVLPGIAYAIDIPQAPHGGLDLLEFINRIINLIWPIFIGFSVIMFIVAGWFFISAQGDPGKIREARSALIWGAIGVIVGILAFFLPYTLYYFFLPSQ